MNSFADLRISEAVLRGLRSLGFEKPFPIQTQAIPPLLKGQDVIGQAKTGTGKTAAFGVPLIESINPHSHDVQGLILVPTRELAIQVARDLTSYGRYKGVRAVAIYGGQSIHSQMQLLQNGAPIAVGTPGRTIDHIERGSLELGRVKFVVLDEADRMLDMGFIDDVEFILRKVPPDRQTALFSATMPEEICLLARRYMVAPKNILVDSDDPTVEGIDQFYGMTTREGKLDVLCQLLKKEIGLCIVFCATKRATMWLERMLRQRGFPAVSINGDLSQSRRDEAMRLFRQGRRKILVATDLAGRGLDIEGVTHIINFDTPKDPLTYLHRVGRTGRAGRTGTAITLVTPFERGEFHRIRMMTDNKIREIGFSRQPSAGYHR